MTKDRLAALVAVCTKTFFLSNLFSFDICCMVTCRKDPKIDKEKKEKFKVGFEMWFLW